MKYILLLMAVAAMHTASAQDNKYMDLLKRYKNPSAVNPLLPKFEDLRKKANPFVLNITNSSREKFLALLSNGTKVYALPQDNMPCLKPDMQQFNMPNAGRNVPLYRYPERGAIPNPEM